MTLTELAKQVGTSVSTVSKAFSGSKEISEEVKKSIFKAAKRAGCFEKYYKGPRERPVIALLFPETESEYYGTEIGILEREINRRGADTVVALTRFDPEREARLFSEMVYRLKVDGVIISSSGTLVKNPDSVPLVLFGSGAERSKNADVVSVDMNGAVRELVGVIKEYGHREVGFIGERLTRGKLEAFKQAMRYHGLPFREKFVSEADGARFAAAGEECMQKLIDRKSVPEVIVAAYDQIAYGAMRRAEQNGYKIPDDISFVGVDDISVTEYLGVPLSSVHINLEEVCGKVVDMIFKRIDNRHYRESERVTIPVTVCIRESLLDKRK